jgi:hypothetical protein
MEVHMIGKITTAAAAAILLASVGVASAADHAHQARTSAASHSYYDFAPQTPFNDSYYNRDYWNGVNGVAPANNPLRDPLAGTVFENVAPY